jgi:hypothetical protein
MCEAPELPLFYKIVIQKLLRFNIPCGNLNLDHVALSSLRSSGYLTATMRKVPQLGTFPKLFIILTDINNFA